MGDTCHECVDIVQTLNTEFEVLQSKNMMLEAKLLEYESIDKATDYLHELINNETFNDITCYSPNRSVNCWKNYPLAFSGKDCSINPMWDECWVGVDMSKKYDVCPYTEEGSPLICDIIKDGWDIVDTLNIACPHKGVIQRGAFIVGDKYTSSQERIHLYTHTDISELYEFKASDIIKYYNKEIDTLPYKLIYDE